MAIVNPYWFFSTLAQATAASIGFVIAFVASSYASSAERSRGEVNLFQDRIRRILNEHREPLRTTAEQIGNSVSDQDIGFIHVRIVKFKYEKPYLESREELSETVETELSQVVDEDNLELSKSWIYVVAVRHVLNNLLFENDPVRINEEYQKLLYLLHDPAFPNQSTSENLYKDVHLLRDYGLLPEPDRPPFYSIVRVCQLLFIFGVIVPTGFLLTIDQSIPVVGSYEMTGIVLLSVQLLILTVVSALSLRLLTRVTSMLEQY